MDTAAEALLLTALALGAMSFCWGFAKEVVRLMRERRRPNPPKGPRYIAGRYVAPPTDRE